MQVLVATSLTYIAAQNFWEHISSQRSTAIKINRTLHWIEDTKEHLSVKHKNANLKTLQVLPIATLSKKKEEKGNRKNPTQSELFLFISIWNFELSLPRQRNFTFHLLATQLLILHEMILNFSNIKGFT